MLYLCAIEWEWIAQRPHFLEMELEKHFEITVASPVHVLKKIKKQRNTRVPDSFFTFNLYPYQERVGFLAAQSKRVFRKRAGDINAYDILWLGSPLFIKYVPEDYKGMVIYDYMDDTISMQTSEVLIKAYTDQHNRLCERADIIFASSNYLMNLLPEGAKSKARLLRNAFRGEQLIPPAQSGVSETIRLGYVGTISSWMDWKTILQSLENIPNLEYHFWGPSDGETPQNEKIFYHGVVEHSKIADEIKDMDALLMPFVVNDIIKAVDPVKLYEYISYGKTVISVGYDEVQRFADFVWLYYSSEEYMNILKLLGEGKLESKYDEASQKEFLENNTWRHRAEQAHEDIANTYELRG